MNRYLATGVQSKTSGDPDAAKREDDGPMQCEDFPEIARRTHNNTPRMDLLALQKSDQIGDRPEDGDASADPAAKTGQSQVETIESKTNGEGEKIDGKYDFFLI